MTQKGDQPLTFNQWVVRRAASCQQEADRLWLELDAPQAKEDFDHILAQYNAVCDYMDELETNPERLFSKREEFL